MIGAKIGMSPYNGIVITTTSPDTLLAMPVGALAIDSTTGIWWRNRSGGTRWSPAVIPPTVGGYYFNDLDVERGQLASSNVVGGTGGFTTATGRPGLWFQNVSAVGDATILRANNQALAFGAGAVYFRAAVRVATLSDGVDRATARAGWGDSTTAADHVDGVYLECSLAGNGSNNWFLCAANNSVRTKVDTGIAPVAGSFQNLEILVNAAGTSASAWINDVAAAAPVTTNIPTAVGRECGLHVMHAKDLGTTLRAFTLDWIESAILLTTVR